MSRRWIALIRRPMACAALLLAGVIAGVIAASVAPRVAGAQGYFGQNQVQFQVFEWRIYKTEHFDVHYYQGMAEGAKIAARMAERSYARLSRLMGYTFKERKPIVVFASRGDFAQNNVTGDLGEGTGGVTDAMHQRNMFFFGSDLAEVEHVMTHEMVHQFQYDIMFKGRTGGAQQMIEGDNLPLWFAEGMAEYLSIGPDHKATDAIMRDAALNGNLPTIKQLQDEPNRFFPYRYGESLWRYVGQRWGDEIVGEILQAAASIGVERGFKRHTGFELDEIGDEWKETQQTNYLPAVATLDRPRKNAQALLNEKKTGGIIPVYIAPALSSDGKQIAYISTGSLLRAEVFLDLYLADATTGKRIKRLTNSVLNPETEELRYVYSQSAFSPDGRTLAYTGMRKGKDVIFLLDVRSRNVIRRLDTDLDAMVGPTFSPDGKKLAFSGSKGGLTNIYTIDADGRNLRQLTKGWYAGLMPAWSPDGRKIAFVSDRGPQTNLELLRFGKWEINLLDVASGDIETIPRQGGKNLNPAWSPDGKSLAFISDRTGIAQIFLYDFEAKEHYQLTRYIGGVLSLTENSPAITWARQADKLAFVYFDNNDYTVWSISNPRQLKKEPYRDLTSTAVVASATQAPLTAEDSAAARRVQAALALADIAKGAKDSAAALPANPRRVSIYRGVGGMRASGELPAPGTPGAQSPVSVASLMDSSALALPSDVSIKDEPYKAELRAEAVQRPQVGYQQDNYQRGVYGGTAILFADLLGNRQLLAGLAINGRVEEAQVALNYTNYSDRLNFSTGFNQSPFYLFTGYSTDQVGSGQYYQRQSLMRYIVRTANYNAIYPINRFTRFELGAAFTNIDRSAMYLSQGIDYNSGYSTGFYVDSTRGLGSLNFLNPVAAFVSDNALQGQTGPIYGHRYRVEVAPWVGVRDTKGFVNVLADLRRYDAIAFSFLTLATRFYADISQGPGENLIQKYIGVPQYIRGYDRENYLSTNCGAANATNCNSLMQLVGSHTLVMNAELRFPLIRKFELGILPVSLPPLDGLFFYDAGMAWSSGHTLSVAKPDVYDFNKQRFLLRSYGYGLRLNLFNFAMVRLDYAIPLDSFNHQGYWWWSIGQSF